MILSVSRRCDIPRFRFDWFLECLDRGFVDVKNPFNAAQVRRVPLLPAGISSPADVFAFWTRDPGPILSYADELERRGFLFYVMVTVTGYPAVLEPKVPPAGAICGAMRELAGKIGARRVIWRYDPVFLSSVTGEGFHRANFAALARTLKGSVRRVIISLYDEYAGARRRIEALEKTGGLRVLPVTGAEGRLLPQVRELLGDMARIAGESGMEIQSCAEAEDLSALGIAPGACIDGELIGELWGIEAEGRDKNQRPHCRCAPSVDIGSYGTCAAGCVYCYARR
ncbi:MAG: DUF1848 domain-containing protein [Treponema sp.]|jgi:hypothetical protein|nr:DUF1848 domain-containing protein [Treponema sp.]